MTEDTLVMVDGDDIMIVSTTEAMVIARRQAMETIHELATMLANVQPMPNWHLDDGDTSDISIDPNS